MGKRGGPQPGSGRPKGKKAAHTLMAMAARVRLIEMYKIAADQINTVLIGKALQGDLLAIKVLHDRVYGRPVATDDEEEQVTNQLQLTDDQYKQAIQAAASRSGGNKSST